MKRNPKLDSIVVMFHLSLDDCALIRDYSIKNYITNTNDKLLSIHECCFCIVKGWLDQYISSATAIGVTPFNSTAIGVMG